MSDDFDEVFYRAWFKEKYGRPDILDSDEPHVFVFGHSSREAAEVSAQANSDHWGHPSTVEERDGRWVTVVGCRGSIARKAAVRV